MNDEKRGDFEQRRYVPQLTPFWVRLALSMTGGGFAGAYISGGHRWEVSVAVVAVLLRAILQ